MEIEKAKSLVGALANGVHPCTGEVFAMDSAYQHPDVVRALFTVLKELDRTSENRRETRTPNAGKPWTTGEDDRLLEMHRSGQSVSHIAKALGRTTAGIQARLEKHGLLEGAR